MTRFILKRLNSIKHMSIVSQQRPGMINKILRRRAKAIILLGLKNRQYLIQKIFAY